MFTDIYLEHSWTSVMEPFCFFVLFLQKCSLVNVWQSSKYPTCSVDPPCKMVPLVLFCIIYVIISSSYQYIFIAYKTFAMGKKLKTCQERPDLVSGHFIMVFYKTTTCPRQPLSSGPNSGHLIQVWLYWQN